MYKSKYNICPLDKVKTQYPDVYDKLKLCEINKAQSFMNGLSSSPMIKGNKTANAAMGYAMTAMNTASNVANLGGTMYGDIMSVYNTLSDRISDWTIIRDMFEDTIKMATKEVLIKISTYTIGKTAELLPNPNPIELLSQYGSRVSYWTTTYMISNEEIMKKLTTKSEEIEEENKKNNQNEKLKKVVNSITYGINKINSTVEMMNTYYTAYVQGIMTYVTEGPEWVCDKLNMLADDGIDKAIKFIGGVANNIKKDKDEFIEKLCCNVGRANANVINQKIYDAAEVLQKKQEKEISKTQRKSLAKAKKTILELKAKFGG